MSKRVYGLLGSGEFEPWASDVDRWLLGRAGIGARDRRVLILPAASAPEGDKIFNTWADMGLNHYRELGIEAEVVPLKTRSDAARDDVVAALDGAAMAFFSGGNPAYLAEILRDTPFWNRLLEEMDRGLAFGGCSAGVAFLGAQAPDSSKVDPFAQNIWHPGLQVFPKVVFGPHWDMLDTYIPGLQRLIIDAVPPDCRLVAIDERTAMVGDGTEWTVIGEGSAHLFDGGDPQTFPSGTSFRAPLES